MLTNAEMEIFAAAIISLEVSGALIRESSLVRGPEVRRTAEKPGDVLR